MNFAKDFEMDIDFSSQLVLGRVTPVNGVLGSEIAIFVDGDSANLDPSNLIDYDYFANVYSYENFLEDKITIDQLCSICDKNAHKMRTLEAELNFFKSFFKRIGKQ